MRSFRDSIAWPPCSLCTLRAGVSADYAILTSGWRLPLAGSPFPMTGFIKSISMLLSTSFDYGLSTAREDVILFFLPLFFLLYLFSSYIINFLELAVAKKQINTIYFEVFYNLS